MKLTIQTDYALRTLMYLATIPGRATIDHVATLFGISTHHVGKVVSQLSRLGYVRSIRGIGGGIELAMRPEDISIGEVILASEGNIHLLECVATDDLCSIQSFCKLRTVLSEAERIQMDYLNSVKLTDVIPKRKQLESVNPASAANGLNRIQTR